jgi:hypothetical protein
LLEVQEVNHAKASKTSKPPARETFLVGEIGTQPIFNTRKNMHTHLIDKFERIGARAKLNIIPEQWSFGTRRRPEPRRFRGMFSLDIQNDRKGEYFLVNIPESKNLELDVLDVQVKMRHLLLMARQDGNKDKFLCGHDERHWFTCAVPCASVSNVLTAMNDLRPTDVRESLRFNSLKTRDRLRRRNAAFIRQGEWFFIPEPNLIVPERLILTHEPISRGRGKPHWLENAYRDGGQVVWVCSNRPTGVPAAEYNRLIQRNPNVAMWNWRQMTRDANVFATGAVSHPDHATIHLRGWHRVVMNTEHLARAAKNIVFLD